MRALSIKEPWASLIRERVKWVETRSWGTNYRGELYIHASRSPVPKGDEKVDRLIALLPAADCTGFAYGCLVARCEVVDCIRMDEVYVERMRREHPIEYLCGEYAPGRYAWRLDRIEPLEKPLPRRGMLGIWSFDWGDMER